MRHLSFASFLSAAFTPPPQASPHPRPPHCPLHHRPSTPRSIAVFACCRTTNTSQEAAQDGWSRVGHPPPPCSPHQLTMIQTPLHLRRPPPHRFRKSSRSVSTIEYEHATRRVATGDTAPSGSRSWQPYRADTLLQALVAMAPDAHTATT